MEKTKKIILLFPNPIATIPGGLTYVGKRFKKNNFDVKIYINTFRDFKTADELLNEIIEPFDPDIVGFSFATYNVLEVYGLQRNCKEKGYFVIAGGNHPSIMPEECLRNGADLVFRGESETGIDSFCDWYVFGKDMSKRSQIPGVSYIDDSGMLVNNKKELRIKNLDELGEIDFSSIELDKFRVSDGSVKGLNVISCGRGCPFKCSYCSHRDWYEYSKRSADSIIDEMVKRNNLYGIKTFWLSDETFTVDRGHIYDFCKKFRQENLPFKWMVGTRANSVDEKLLLTMKESGLGQITYGIESADPETLLKINKGYTVEQAYEIVNLTGRLGIPMYINLMTGFPWETVVSVENNIRFIKEVDKYVYCFQLYGAVIPYPDTPIYENYHKEFGFTEFWLNPRYQNAGMVIYQNVPNPYKMSTYFQRNLYDDTYVAEDYFFKFKPEYKNAVTKMGFLIGWKSIQAQTDSLVRQYGKYLAGYFSRRLYDLDHNLEKKLVGSLIKVNKVHENRLTGKFIKK
ncbi:MAG: radical SAM protein [Candidatus Omnitrophica bacterium]|nr:radical SAM protein [Candidatus Omnitrophota bacterium]